MTPQQKVTCVQNSDVACTGLPSVWMEFSTSATICKATICFKVVLQYLTHRDAGISCTLILLVTYLFCIGGWLPITSVDEHSAIFPLMIHLLFAIIIPVSLYL